MNAYLVKHGHFMSHDKDGDHAIQSATATIHANFMARCFIELELLFYIAGTEIFNFFAPVTLTR